MGLPEDVITERQGEFGHFAKLEKENENLKARCEEYRIRIRELEKSNEECYLRGCAAVLTASSSRSVATVYPEM